MSRSTIILRTLVVLTLIWGAVWSVRAIAGSMKITADKISREVDEAKFVDCSGLSTTPDPALVLQRDRQIREITGLINRLDFQERANHRRNGTDDLLFRKLSPSEQVVFVDLTVMKAINSFLDSLEALPVKQRKRFIEQGLKLVANDAADTPVRSINPILGPLLEKLDVKDLRFFISGANAATKFSIAPLVEAINESIQGLRGNEFGPPHREF